VYVCCPRDELKIYIYKTASRMYIIGVTYLDHRLRLGLLLDNIFIGLGLRSLTAVGLSTNSLWRRILFQKTTHAIYVFRFSVFSIWTNRIPPVLLPYIGYISLQCNNLTKPVCLTDDTWCTFLKINREICLKLYGIVKLIHCIDLFLSSLN